LIDEPGADHPGGGDALSISRAQTEELLRETERELRFRVGLEALVTGLSTRLLGVRLHELEDVVREGMRQLCEYFGLDRAYAIKVVQPMEFDLNVQWWAPGVEQKTTPIGELPHDAQRFWARTLRSGTVVHIPDVDDVEDADVGAGPALRQDGVKSILFLPLIARGATVGFLGLEARRQKCRWSEESIALMRTVGELFVNAAERCTAEEALARTAAELEQRNAELERSNRELEQFASIVSHDLKSPLQVVRGFVELLGRESTAGATWSDEAQTYVSAALRGAERMDRLIDDLLTYSRAGQRPATFTPIDVNRLVTEVLADSAALVREADASVHVDRLPTVAADETQLRQLLQNLLHNAVKFRRQDRRPEVWIDAVERAGEWEFHVDDNGIGIDPRHREEIFGMFTRVHQGDAPGSGIGLAVCARVAENHGGRIWVDDSAHGGSCFLFTIAKDLDLQRPSTASATQR